MVQVCWQTLYAWQQGKRIVLRFCWPPCFGKNCWPPSRSPPVCFMHLQTSVTLIDTLWNSLKLHFHMKTQVPKSTQDLQAIMGLRKHKLCKIIICCTPTTLYPTPFSLLLMNVKMEYQSKVNSISCHRHHLFIISGSSFRHQDLMFTFFPICFQIEKLGTHKELELTAINTFYSLHTLVLSCKYERNSHTFDLWIQYNSFLSIFWAFFCLYVIV